MSSSKGKKVEQPWHIEEGEGDCPPLVPGSLRCYNMKYCPFAQRTVLALVHKNVQFDIVNINLKKKPEWFLKRAQMGKVPTLEREDGEVITESLVTMAYLDEQYPEPPMLPSDPWKRAQDKVLCEVFSAKIVGKIHSFYYKSYDEDEKKEKIQEIMTGLDDFENELKKRNTKFFSGDVPGYLDLAIWPWFERIPVFTKMTGNVMMTDRHTKLMSWTEAMLATSTVKAVLVPVDEHLTFIQSFMTGTPDYNFNSAKL